MNTLQAQSSIKLSRAEKILLVLGKLSGGTRKGIRYEDIVVEAFKHFPEDFHLRGYSKYPDSGDLIHKPLYGFRKIGYLEANNKVFTLTQRGLSALSILERRTAGKSVASEGKLARYAAEEISRISILEGFRLFVNGEESKITDTDLYNYLGVTARTGRNDFLGRLRTVEDAVAELKKLRHSGRLNMQIPKYHEFMTSRFKSIFDFKSRQQVVE